MSFVSWTKGFIHKGKAIALGKAIADMFGVTERSVDRAIKVYRAHGIAELRRKPIQEVEQG
jgi:transposase